MIKKVTCIVCPQGCSIEISLDGNDEILSINGNECKKGEDYARKEAVKSLRTLTTSVLVINGEYPLVSAKLDRPVEKDTIYGLMKTIRATTVKAPIKIGDVLLEDLNGLCVVLVATSNCGCKLRK